MFRKIAAATSIAVACALLLGSQIASAAPYVGRPAGAGATARPVGMSAARARAWVAGQVRGLLAENPGAKQISPYSVSYKNAVLGVTPPRRLGAKPQSASGVCPNNNVCLFWDIDFDYNMAYGAGYWIEFSKCDVNYNLYDYYSNGGSWADRTSSIDYPGSNNGNEAKFNHDGDWWLYLYRDHYLKDLVNDGGPNPQHNSNDWITGLYAC